MKLFFEILFKLLDAENVYRIFNTVVQGSSICSSETQKICFQILGRFISVFGK